MCCGMSHAVCITNLHVLPPAGLVLEEGVERVVTNGDANTVPPECVNRVRGDFHWMSIWAKERAEQKVDQFML